MYKTAHCGHYIAFSEIGRHRVDYLPINSKRRMKECKKGKRKMA
jgi:hypothetical protein